jgi:hypothetical protein
MNDDGLPFCSSAQEAAPMSKQTAYDYFLGSLSMEIIKMQEVLVSVDANAQQRPTLLQKHADLQRLLVALDEIYQVVPDDYRETVHTIVVKSECCADTR